MSRRFLATVVLAMTLLTLAVAARQRSVSQPSTSTTPAGAPTFNKEIVRIFQQHCQSCHHPNDIAPFSLMTYADAKPRATMIKIMTQTKKMPPWKPTPGCGDFADARVLPQSDIDLIAKWVDSGAPEGNAADLPQERTFDGGWEMGTPDLTVKLPTPYTPAAHGDTYRCFTLPTNLTSDRWVKAIDVKPGNRETVHHVIAYLDTTGESLRLDDAEPGLGYTCFGGPNFSNPGTLGGWAPGARPVALPENVGMPLAADARVVLQIHYHPHHGEPGPDQTELGIYYTDRKPEKELFIVPLINTTFTIPPNDSNYKVSASFPVFLPVKVYVVAPHMHLLGRKMTVEATLPGGQKQCLINIDDWDFNWQGMYRFREPLSLPLGSRLTMNAFFDNSSGNPRNPNNPPKPVSWGEETTDEMAIAFLGITLE